MEHHVFLFHKRGFQLTSEQQRNPPLPLEKRFSQSSIARYNPPHHQYRLLLEKTKSKAGHLSQIYRYPCFFDEHISASKLYPHRISKEKNLLHFSRPYELWKLPDRTELPKGSHQHLPQTCILHCCRQAVMNFGNPGKINLMVQQKPNDIRIRNFGKKSSEMTKPFLRGKLLAQECQKSIQVDTPLKRSIDSRQN